MLEPWKDFKISRSCLEPALSLSSLGLMSALMDWTCLGVRTFWRITPPWSRQMDRMSSMGASTEIRGTSVFFWAPIVEMIVH